MEHTLCLQQTACLDNLKLAFNYAKDDAKKFFIPDFFRHQDYTHSSGRLLRDLSIKLIKKQYRPKVPLEVEVPKSGLAVRPGVVIDFQDFIVLYAITNVIVDAIEINLPDNVYSLRLVPKGKRKTDGLFKDRAIPLLPLEKRGEIKEFEEWYEAWPAFDNKTKEFVMKEGYNYLVTTDITAYFENINHGVLKETLISCVKKSEHYLINLLMDILGQWTVLPPLGNRIDRGIPQGNTISSYMGNVYLIPLDRQLTKLEAEVDIKYLRYMDDVKILAKNKKDARQALFVLNKALRELQLNVQTSKTDIVEQPDLIELIYDERFDKASRIVEEIQKRSQSGKITRIDNFRYENELNEYFRQVPRKLKKSKDIRLFKRLLTGYIYLESRRPIHRCFSVIVDNPSLTDKIVRYYKIFQLGEKIPEHVLGLLHNKDEEIFEYQIARLAEIFKYKSHLPSGLETILFEQATDVNAHWSIRSSSLVALSYLNLSSDKMKKLWDLFKEELNYHVKRAMLLCFINGDPDKRNEAIKHAMFDTDSRVTLFVKFIQDILEDEQTQLYEIKNIFRIAPPLFIDESYKLILLRESSSPSVLNKLVSNLNKLNYANYPNHVRYRINKTKEYILDKL